MAGNGSSGMGMSDLLLSASTSKGAFYHHFKSKEALGLEILRESFRACFAELERMSDAEPGQVFPKRFWHWLETLLGDALGQLCLIAQLQAEAASLPAQTRHELKTSVGYTLGQLAQCLAALPAENAPQAGDAGQLARILYGLWLGTGLLSRVDASTRPRPEAITATRTLLNLSQQS